MSIKVIEKGYSSILNKTNKISISEAKQIILPVIIELIKNNIPFQFHGSIGLSIYCIDEEFQKYWENRKTDDVEIIVSKKYWKRVKNILTDLGFEEDYTKNYIKISKNKNLKIIHPFKNILIFKKKLDNKEFYFMVLDKNSKITIIKNGEKVTFSPIVTEPPEIGIIIGKIIRLSSKDKKDLEIIFLSNRILNLIDKNLDTIIEYLSKYNSSIENLYKIKNRLKNKIYGYKLELKKELENIEKLKSMIEQSKSNKLMLILSQKQKIIKEIQKRIDSYSYAIHVLSKLINNIEYIRKRLRIS